MSELTTAVNELLKSKHIEENVHKYTEGLSSLYKRMAYLRLTMNYFTFAEIFTENRIMDEATDVFQEIVKKVIIDSEIDEKLIDDISSFRTDIINKMEILTSYVDIFQIYEYMLNRVEYRFKDSEFTDRYYNGELENDIFAYILSDRDNSVINMKITQVVGQLPMRLSTNKFFNILENAFSLYKGTDRNSVNDFAYMIKTAGGIHRPTGFNKAFPEIKKAYDKLTKLDLEQADEKMVKKYRDTLDSATAKIETISDYYVMMTEIVNDLYIIALTKNSLFDVIEKNKFEEIIVACYNSIEELIEPGQELTDKLNEFVGYQERLNEVISFPSNALDEIIDINRAELEKLDLISDLEELEILYKLQSGSTFANLEVNEAGEQIAGDEYVKEVFERLVGELTECLSGARLYKRAVMAMIITNLPVFFGNFDEFKSYVHTSLLQCNDSAERQAVMAIVNLMIAGE